MSSTNASVLNMNDLPEIMRAVNITEFGAADNLEIVQMPVPAVRDDEVLIKVRAAGINRPDIYQRLGSYPAPAGASEVLGLEVAGDVVAVGEAVTKWQIGDTVCALLAGGGYAEYAVATDSLCLSIPEPFGYIQAAAIPENFFTVWRNLFDIAKLQADETLLIHGGASGIGTSAIQLATEMGIRVFVTAGSDDKCEVCERLGAELAINYKKDDFVEKIEGLAGKHAINVTLDMVGGDYVQRNLKLAAVDGRIVNIGFLQSSTATVDFMQMMLKRIVLTGSTLRGQPIAVKSKIAKKINKKVWPLFEEGAITPVIHQSIPFEQVVDAHKMMESNEHAGKLVLTFD